MTLTRMSKGSKSKSKSPNKGKNSKRNQGFDFHDVKYQLDEIECQGFDEKQVNPGQNGHDGHGHGSLARASTSSSKGSFDSPSRIPLYTANGFRPHHTPLHQRNKALNHTSTQSCCCDLSPYCSHKPSLVPPNIQWQHLQHTMLNHSHSGSSRTPSRSAAGSGRTTPSTSLSSTPTRPCFAKNRRSSGSNVFAQKTIGDNMYFEEYMPLCELQKGLKKGQVLEGILRINPKNYEDAYISAPVMIGISFNSSL